MSADINDRLHEIVNGATARRGAAERISAFIEGELERLRQNSRGTAAMQYYLLGVQRELALERAAAMHVIADVAGVRP